MTEVKENTHIALQENCVPPFICEEIIKRFEASDKKFPGMVVNPSGEKVVDEAQKISLDFDLTANTDAEFDKTLFWLLNRGFKTYLDMYPVLNRFKISDSGYFLTKYPKGKGFYEWHVDADGPKVSNRLFSCILYLNTVDEGGGTQFKDQNVQANPIMGNMIFFPSGWTHQHRGMIPVSQDKYILTSFFHITKEE